MCVCVGGGGWGGEGERSLSPLAWMRLKKWNKYYMKTESWLSIALFTLNTTCSLSCSTSSYLKNILYLMLSILNYRFVISLHKLDDCYLSINGHYPVHFLEGGQWLKNWAGRMRAINNRYFCELQES